MLDSVRTRLTFWYVGVLALVLLAFSAGTYALLARSLRERLDAGLRSTVETMALSLERERAEGESEEEAARSTIEDVHFPLQSLAVCDAAGRLLAGKSAPGQPQPILPSASLVPADTPAFHTLPIEQEECRVALRRVRVTSAESNFIVVAGQSRNTITEELESLRRIFFIAIPLCLALAGMGGWFLARKALAPVVAMSEQARRIGAENLQDRLPVANPRDELGRLATTFNELLARLGEAFARQERAIALQRQFMADASHELRTPLSVLRTAGEVTMEQPHRDESEYREALAMINQQTLRLACLVEDMFTLARADAGRRELELSDFYLDELLAETARAAAVLAERKGVRVAERSSPETLYRGDEGLLRQMLLNLLDNAIKHTPRGGEVDVTLARSASTVEITVADTGAGIPLEDQPKIFERFFRADKARSRTGGANGGGGGLGLSIARWIAEAHDGTLELRRSGAHGSVFAASLPISTQAGRKV